jgi:cyclomaltodextrinase
MKHALFTLAAVAVLSCTNKENTDKPTAEIVGLCSPIKLQHEQTTIYLQDYFLNPEAIDSFHLPVELRWKYNAKDSTRLIATGNLNRAFGLFTAYSNGSAFNIPIKRSTRLGYSFAFDPGNARYQRVQIRGSFNAWNQHADTFYVEDGIYKTDLILQPGTYEYLLVLDGEEQVDPTNPERVSNGQGGYNSVLRLADASPDPNQVKTLRVNDTGFALYLYGYSRDAQDLITLWQNEVMLPTGANGDTIFYTIPKAASSLDRSFIRAFTGNETKFGNDLLIPLQNGRVITNTASLTRNDWEAASLYFLMIDRFKNGNTANDSTVHDSLIHPRANYYGGDIAGVTQAIEAGYFDSLGMNTVWISPVTQNPWDAWGYKLTNDELEK